MPEMYAYSQLLSKIPLTSQPLLRVLPRDDPDLVEHILDAYAREELQRLNDELKERKRVLEEKLAELHERLKELEELKARLEAKRRRLEHERADLQGRISSLEETLDNRHAFRSSLAILRQDLAQAFESNAENTVQDPRDGDDDDEMAADG